MKVHFYNNDPNTTQTFYNFTSENNKCVNYSVSIDQNRQTIMNSGEPYLFSEEPVGQYSHNAYDGTVIYASYHTFPERRNPNTGNKYSKS